MTSHTAAVYGLLLILTTVPPLLHAAQPPIVVKDLGGASALPYYEALSLQARSPGTPRPLLHFPRCRSIQLPKRTCCQCVARNSHLAP